MDQPSDIDLAPCGLLRLGPDYRILSANRYFVALTGRPSEEIHAGLNFGTLFSVASRIFIQTRMQPDLTLAGRVEELALDLVRPDGSRLPVMLNATLEAGIIRIALWGAAAKRAYEAEAPKARRAAEVASQVKSDFLGNISHELRTPLNAIVGGAGMLRSTPLSDRQAELVEMIEGSAASLGRLIADTLDLSRVQAGSLSLEEQSFDLSETLAPALERAALQAREKGLTFLAEISPEAQGSYRGDPVRLRQIASALLSNAVKFTAHGEVRAIATHGAGGLAIAVSDTGVGFDPTLTEQLFEAFGQAATGATRAFGGAGMGLSIVKGLVELMGGAVLASSEPGCGSRFDVLVPLERAEAVLGSPPADGDEPDLSETPLRILLVEDNPTNRRVVELILESCDVELTSAENGALGLECWRQGGFDVVLMDLQMPVMDGLTAIREIRRIEAESPALGRTPIAVLSANAMEHHRREAVEAGANLHIPKPVSPQALLEGITQVLGGLNAAA